MPLSSPALSRRRALQLAAVSGAGLAVAAATPAAAEPRAAMVPSRLVFAHGVASGDPLPDAVVLWTRVTPVAAATPGSGAGPDVTVRWEVAADEGFGRVVRSGAAPTSALRDHTVSVDVDGLEPATSYWYRFRLGGAISPVGRTRTAPAADDDTTGLRLAVVSCANWMSGWFTAYRALAARGDLDLVVHLGDYFYEYGPGQVSDLVLRPHDPPRETITLADYRRRHAQYKTDPDLQALHAAAPWVVTWDDHETANDAWSGGAANHTPGEEGDWATRLAAARQAYAEWMPVRFGAGGRLYRQLRFGRLASLSMLDLRSYRDQQVPSLTDPARLDPARTITGADQLGFLLDALDDDAVRWKLIGNPDLITPIAFPERLNARDKEVVARLIDSPRPGASTPWNVDLWDGYPAERAQVLGHVWERGITGAVFLTGDLHCGMANDIPVDPASYPQTRESVAVELVCTSVTGDNLDDALGVPPRTTSLLVEQAIQANNPHVQHLDYDSHGFSVLDVTPDAVQMDWYVLTDRLDPEAAAVWSTSFRVRAGSTNVERAGRRLA